MHFIDNEQNINKKILSFKLLEFAHTAPVILNTIMATTIYYGIQNKILSIAFDNTSNNIATVSLLKQSLNPILDGDCLYIRCVCHILNLCI